MDTKPPTRTLPKLVMKEWPEKFVEEILKADKAEPVATFTSGVGLLEWLNGRPLSDFTRVVDQTGILKQPTAFDAAMDETRKEDAEFWEGIERDLKP